MFYNMTDEQIHELALDWARNLYGVNIIAYYERYYRLQEIRRKYLQD